MTSGVCATIYERTVQLCAPQIICVYNGLCMRVLMLSNLCVELCSRPFCNLWFPAAIEAIKLMCEGCAG
jgi:hypothetical protein